MKKISNARDCVVADLHFAGLRLLKIPMRFLLLTLAAACACSLSCERHEFEGKQGTKQLHESHGAHAAPHADPDTGTTGAH